MSISRYNELGAVQGYCIFSAFSPLLRRGLRIIQHEPEEQGMELVWWLGSSTGDDGGNVDEMVISCAVSDEAERLARSLIKSWALGGPMPVEANEIRSD